MMKVPKFEDPEVTRFLNMLILELDKKDKIIMSKITANHSLLLQSPSLKVFEVTVTDAGALVVAVPPATARKELP
jgi:hypothetical protein